METLKIHNPGFLAQSRLKNRGRNAETTQRENRALIVRLIKEAGTISRLELAEITGLQHATVTIIINGLLESRVIEKAGMVQGTNGRRVTVFSIKSQQYCMIAVRITNRYIKVGVYDLNGDNIYIDKVFLNTLEDMIQTCKDTCEIILKSQSAIGDMKVIGVGIGVEGAYTIVDNDYAYYDKNRKENIFVGKEIHKQTGYKVVVNRGKNYTAYFYWNRYWKKPLGTLIAINLGYSVEAGIVINGEILNGKDGCSGIIGNNQVGIDASGKNFYLEDRVSAGHMLRKTNGLLKEYPESVLQGIADLNIRDIIQGYQDGDELSRRIYDDAAVYLGKAVASLVNLLNPDAIFIGDEVPAGDNFLQVIRQTAEKYTENSMEDVIVRHKVKRVSQNDPALIGATEYVVAAAIETGELDF